jgi:hypothetical protein
MSTSSSGVVDELHDLGHRGLSGERFVALSKRLIPLSSALGKL